MRTLNLLAMLAMGSLTCVTAAAADPAAPGASGKGAESEEFVISKDLPGDPNEVRKALFEAEDRFYARYNELNKDDEYDIVCRLEAPTGKRLRERSCEPRFVETTTRDDSAGGLNASRSSGGGNARITSPTDSKVAQKYEELRQRMQRLASEDPALRSALVERGRLEQAYKAALQKK